MTSDLGTLAWGRRTGGVLTPADSRKLLKDVLFLQLMLIPEEWMHKLGLKRPRDIHLDIDAISGGPGSEAARKAEAACREASEGYLLQHCHRSYLWGVVLAELAGMKPDRELLFVAAMLHDMGLTEKLAGAAERPACFTIISAEAAQKILGEAGWEQDRIDTVAEAITLHMNMGVDLHYGPEAHVLNLATALDTTGLRLWRVSKAEADAIVRLHPRYGQNKALAACWGAEAKRFPDTRAGWVDKYLQFEKRLLRAPFES